MNLSERNLFRATVAATIGVLALAFISAQPKIDNSPKIASEDRDPALLYSASCSTCHGARGGGGYFSWAIPYRWAPEIAHGYSTPQPLLEQRYRFAVRNGPYRHGDGFTNAMPAFGREVISDTELEALVRWLIYAPPIGGAVPSEGVPPPQRPNGREIVVSILDEAPWFMDDGTDVRDPFNDPRRVVLSPGDYIKVVNRGKTWHTVTSANGFTDTGFIGYSANIPWEEVGYYYLTIPDLVPGAQKYYCKLHPYMQLEIVTPEADPMPLTGATKIPLGLPPRGGIGEVWVGLQTYDNGNGPNGAIQIINAADWSSTLIPGVGNNPHNGWGGTAVDWYGNRRRVSVWANWHDITASIIDIDTKEHLGDFPVGAASAHVMTAPGVVDPITGADRWFITLMGSNKVQEALPLMDLVSGMPNLPPISQASGLLGQPAFSPHGIWFLDNGRYFITANTLANTASLYSIDKAWSDEQGRAGVGMELAQASTGGRTPLAASVFNSGKRGDRRYTVYTNNAGTDDISVYRVDTTPGFESIVRVNVPPPLGNAAGNIALSDPMMEPMRWAHMPIQCAVSPPDASAHGRYMVVCNKASFNVTIIALGDTGMPEAIYTFPCGLGSHGVSFGRSHPVTGGKGYYAYVTNTFENYISVYDLELLERLRKLERYGMAPAEFLPGGAQERAMVRGHAAMMLTGEMEAEVPITLFSPDARGLVHVGDIPLAVAPGDARTSYLKEHVMIDVPGFHHAVLDLDLKTQSGAMGVFCWPLPSPWR